jgi:hypothetical protein
MSSSERLAIRGVDVETDISADGLLVRLESSQ